jgi:reticulon-4-interacting protein 1, mitochondrial
MSKDTPGKRLVVLGGSSAIGMYTIFIAKARGWKVLTSCLGRNADFVTNTMGADEVAEYTVESVPGWVKAWKPDAIVDCVGSTECLGIAKRYVTIAGDKTARATMGGTSLLYPRMVLTWVWGRFRWGERYDCIMLDQKEYLHEVVDMLPAEKIMVDSTFAFEDAKKAFEKLNTGRARGKVVGEIG